MWIVPAKVVSVHDGDTLTVTVDLEKRVVDLGWHVTLNQLITTVVHVRLAHINAPELGAAGGIEARDFLRAMLDPAAELILNSHSLDKYGRTLGTITLPDGRDVSKEMLSSGHAVPYEGGSRLV